MKLVWIIVGGILIGGVVGGAFFLFKSNKSAQPVELAPVTAETSPTPTSEPEMKKHQNEAGFSFEYPGDVTITENKLDATSYANLTLTSNKNEGSIEIKIVDTKLKDNTAWQKANQSRIDKTEDVMLGDVKALRNTDEKGVYIAAVGQSVLYTIDIVDGENQEYWENVFDQILSSWTFELPEATAPPSKSSGSAPAPASGGDIYEEETIE